MRLQPPMLGQPTATNSLDLLDHHLGLMTRCEAPQLLLS